MPTRDTPWPNGTPCWVDYGAADMDATKAFYTDLFGWTFTESSGDEYGGYINALKDDRQVAGFGPLMGEGDSPAWTTYFAADDAAAIAAKIRDAGGAVVMEPMEVAPFGTMVIALDPQGNSFGLWQSAQHTGVRVHNEPGALAWNEAMVDDTASAKQFYSAVFGFTFDQMSAELAGEGMDYATFSTGGNPLGGLGASDPSMPKGWLTCFSVASADETVATVAAKGGKVTMPPMDTPFGRFAIVEDPWGAPFEVMQDPPAS
ncbi:VOC family protein [Blastococcus sp. CT_GayMR19]|uniref:VOC family protein n=1 Tax=Blastococcus sp. CT_GayMR19 TaxID=2559608 RepID=UPI001073C20E|nr:VOC family protein [Blastococcus sp. CT_GayMR19]TFV73455.1 VOC family protein [Blastococcus sp. CT_GayMR19]